MNLQLTAHLTPATMARAHRDLVAKAIAEFAHERLLAPEPDDDGWRLDLGRSAYTFTARRHPLEHWVVDPASIARTVDGEETTVDAQDFVVDCNDALGIPDHLLPVYLEEIASTLASAAWKLTHHQLSSADLVHADHQAIEAAMTEGHPGFVACNGRIGWGVDDYAAYAPETGADVRLQWVAVRRDEAQLSLSDDRTEEEHYLAELGEDVLVDFEKRLRERGLDPVDYLYLPVHPWQWTNRLAVTFAPDVARQALVPLGEVDAAHRAQQSIRTFFPVDHPERSLREGRPGHPEHGLPARALARLHGRHAGDQRLGRRARGRRRRARGHRLLGPPGARRHRLDRRRLPPAPGHRRPTARWSPRCGARARCPGSPTASGWRRWRRCCTATGTAAPLVVELIGASGLEPRRVGRVATSGPTSDRSCTACSPTTSRSCRTARTSSWCCATTCRPGW